MEKEGRKIKRRVLTREQKIARGRAVIMQLIKEFAIKNNMPDPFPVNPVEKEKFETYKKNVIARDKELEYWDNYVMNNKWIQEYVEEDQLKEIVEGKPDKSKWTDTQWHAHMMANVLKKMAKEKSKEESQEDN